MLKVIRVFSLLKLLFVFIQFIVGSLGWCLKGPFKNLAKETETGNRRHVICLANRAFEIWGRPNPYQSLSICWPRWPLISQNSVQNFFIEIKYMVNSHSFFNSEMFFSLSSRGGQPNAVLSWLICWANLETQETFSHFGVNGEKSSWWMLMVGHWINSLVGSNHESLTQTLGRLHHKYWPLRLQAYRC